MSELICLETGEPVKAQNVISCRCANCFSYLCELEDAATCEHGFLVGCAICCVRDNEHLVYKS